MALGVRTSNGAKHEKAIGRFSPIAPAWAHLKLGMEMATTLGRQSGIRQRLAYIRSYRLADAT